MLDNPPPADLPIIEDWCVYLIAFSQRGPTKIGISCDLIRRLNDLQVGNPYRLRIFFAAHVPDQTTALAVEKRILINFGSFRLVGEWLKLPPAQLVDAVKKALKHPHRWQEWKPTEQQRERRASQLNGGAIRRAADAMSEYEWLKRN